MENKQFQQLYFLILPLLVDSFVERSLYACRVYRYLVLCSSSSLREGGNTYLWYTCMYLPTQEDTWSLSKNHHHFTLHTHFKDDESNKVGGTR